MNSLLKQIVLLSNGYARKGGKINRAQQRDRMIAFGEFCSTLGARSLEQVGARHVIRYWRARNMLELSDRTRGAHFYALRTLWKLAGKPGEPPRPFSQAQRQSRSRE